MMERLMEMAKRVSDQVELYALEETGDGVSFENGKLKEIESQSQSGISLRIIKDGQLGFAYTKNLINREEFLENALDSLKGKVEAPFDFPFTRHLPPLDTYDPSIEHLSNRTMVEECQRVCECVGFKDRGTGQCLRRSENEPDTDSQQPWHRYFNDLFCLCVPYRRDVSRIPMPPFIDPGSIRDLKRSPDSIPPVHFGDVQSILKGSPSSGRKDEGSLPSRDPVCPLVESPERDQWQEHLSEGLSCPGEIEREDFR